MADLTTGELQAVAVGDLPLAPDIYDDTLIPVEQGGEAKHMTGAQWKEYAKSGVNAYVTAAQDAAAQAEQAAKDAQKAADAVVDVTEDAEAADAAAKTAQAAQTAAEQARQAAEQAASTAAETAATDAVNSVNTQLAQHVSDAQAAKKAAEQARDEAQAIAGGNFLPLAGGTMTGPLTLHGYPTEDLHAVPKRYVDEALENLDLNVTADEVTFADGQTFQQKYDSGELTGPAGADGQPGADGYTPQKGTDYWTTADKQEMVNDVLAALPTWTGGSY